MIKRSSAFTLTEVLVSVTILVALVLLVSQLFVSVTRVTTSGHKRMDADAQIRPVFERFAVDVAQMVRRSDVDLFMKGSAAPNSAGGTMPGNDQLAFYSAVPGYQPSGSSASSISLVSYRIAANKLERMAKGLTWNGTSPSDTPVVFLPLTIAANWPAATNNTVDPDCEPVGPYVFRLEYYYVLKNGTLSVTPWDTTAGHTSASGLQDLTAISICMAALDPKSAVILDNSSQIPPPNDNISKLGAKLIDYTPGTLAGQLLANWQQVLNNKNGVDSEIAAMPHPAVSSVRLYERYVHLNRQL
jgi:type II secretory pathway component PulJ